MNQHNKPTDDDMMPEYDFSAGKRGKHHAAYSQGTNVILLDPDVAEFFRDSASVNEALRVLARIAREQANSSRTA
jgi:hypothetical protein